MALPVRFPGEALDSEALVVAPDGSTFWLFEKVDAERARLFRHPGPLANGRRVDLVAVGTFVAPGVPVPRGRMVTAADLHPSGTRLLLRVYAGSYEYRFEAGQGPDDLPDLQPVVVSVGPLSEPQGETIAYDEAGTGILTVSEDPMLEPGQPIHHYRCRD